jgi:hypothetical protein
LKPLIYVAGPITRDPFGCVRQSLDAWERLRALDAVPFCPQWSVLPEMVKQRHYEEWMAYDFDVIAHCDALVRLPGESPGADREIEHAETVGIPWFGVDLVGGGWYAIEDWIVAFAGEQLAS